MPQTKPVPIKDLALDLGNFRTVKQPTERAAIDAMISTSPDRFWALTGSLLDSGYLPTESVIVHDIGLDQLGFDRIRDKDVDFGVAYGLPAGKTSRGETKGKGRSQGNGSRAGATGAAKAAAAATKRKRAAAQKAVATGDPRAVKLLFQDFQPVGKKREKLVALQHEIITLDLRRTPLAFCFVLRSMFELSAKAYCADHAAFGGPSVTKGRGEERHLVEIHPQRSRRVLPPNLSCLVNAGRLAKSPRGRSPSRPTRRSGRRLQHILSESVQQVRRVDGRRDRWHRAEGPLAH